MIKRVLLSIASLFLATQISAAVLFSEPMPQPERCPSTAQIKAEGLSGADLYFDEQYVVYHLSHYDVKEKWIFVIYPVDGNNESEAISTGNKLLDKLSGNPKPTPSEDSWLCEYVIKPGMYVVAMTDADISNASIKRLLLK